jgi:exopolysaccharide biosynthesis predicted pyruvyltransferase EpsI
LRRIKVLNFRKMADLMTELDSSLKLADLFCANRNRQWYFVKPGGNWGDRLIYAGAECLARSLGLRWTDLDSTSIGREQLTHGSGIYLHGGGGFNAWGSGHPFSNLQMALKVPESLVIQGPQSCDTSDATSTRLSAAFSNAVCSDIHFFAREANSAEFLAKILPGTVKLHLDHDTAFHLSQDELLTLSKLKKFPTGRYSLVVSREDDEMPSTPVITSDAAVKLDPAYYATSFSHWLRIHAFSTRIISNRLHSAIVGSLLGKPTDLMPGSYHKNRSIWEFSLRERGVKWCEPQGAGIVPASGSDWLPLQVAASWKVRRFRLWLRGVPMN